MSADAPTPSSFVPTCAQCAYPLAGLADEGLCPECGEPFGQEAQQQAMAELARFAQGPLPSVKTTLDVTLTAWLGWLVVFLVHPSVTVGLHDAMLEAVALFVILPHHLATLFIASRLSADLQRLWQHQARTVHRPPSYVAIGMFSLCLPVVYVGQALFVAGAGVVAYVARAVWGDLTALPP